MTKLDDATLGRITRAVFTLDLAASGKVIGRVLFHVMGDAHGETCGIPSALAELDAIRAEHWWMELRHSPSGKHVAALAQLEKALDEVRRVLVEANE